MSRWADSRLVSSALENATIWLPCLVALHLVPIPSAELLASSVLAKFLYLSASATIIVEGNIFGHHLLNEHIYAHVPRFEAGGARPSTAVATVFSDFCVTMIPATILAAIGFSVMLHFTLDEEAWQSKEDLGHGTFRPGPFVGRWLLVRIVVDVCFYGLHWAMHLDQSRPRGGIYNTVHKRHHEHRSPHVWTNYHFSMLDLIFEGFVPYGVALILMEVLHIRCSTLETFGLLSHIMYFEAGSHSGKPVPTVSFFPMGAVLYRSGWFCKVVGGDVDANNVLFHHTHHVLRRCNFGITQWCDLLLGTGNVPDKFQAPNRKDTKSG